MAAPTIRDATLRDACSIADIYNQAVLHTTATFADTPESVEEREGWLLAHGDRHPVIVAEIAGKVVGWASLSRWSDRAAYDHTAEVSTYVDEAWQGRGVGTRLTTAIIERGRASGMHALVSRVCAENQASVTLFRRLGFTAVGVTHEVGWKFGRWLDVEILELVFGDVVAGGGVR
jgi:L-amino acid N-acyltransferase YncA